MAMTIYYTSIQAMCQSNQESQSKKGFTTSIVQTVDTMAIVDMLFCIH
jgi:hypothetical protein